MKSEAVHLIYQEKKRYKGHTDPAFEFLLKKCKHSGLLKSKSQAFNIFCSIDLIFDLEYALSVM